MDRLNEFVVFVDNQIYARDREDGIRRRARVFLINESTGEVYRRNGQDWEAVPEDFRSSIISNNICMARDNRIPIDSLRD
jgi:hypothetical protein